MPCAIDLMVEEGVACAIDDSEIHSICHAVLGMEKVKRRCLLSISVVSDHRMRELNLQWRAQDRPTDVLSLECERPDDPDLGDGEPCELGDIVIAPAYIRRQAEGFGTTPEDETRLLLVHGILHLLGYDHIDDEEAQIMEAREDEILESIATDGSVANVELTRHAEEASA